MCELDKLESFLTSELVNAYLYEMRKFNEGENTPYTTGLMTGYETILTHFLGYERDDIVALYAETRANAIINKNKEGK